MPPPGPGLQVLYRLACVRALCLLHQPWPGGGSRRPCKLLCFQEATNIETFKMHVTKEAWLCPRRAAALPGGGPDKAMQGPDKMSFA